MKQQFFLTAFIICLACNNSTSSEEKKDAIVSDTSAVTQQSALEETLCYARMDKDTIKLRLTKTGDAVTGTLEMQIEGRDKNTGTVNGKMTGDTLIVDYTFMSEGTQSVRQIAYLKKANMLIEGYGDVEEREGKMVFKNTGSLKFDEKMSLAEAPCIK